MSVRRRISKLGIAVGVLAFVVGIVAVPIFTSFDDLFLRPGPECKGFPSIHPGECNDGVPTDDGTFPWDRQQAEAREFFREFQMAVAANDRKRVASLMMYPLRVNFYDDPRPAEYRFLKSPDELLRNYDKIFHSSVKDYIAHVDPNDIWGNDYFLQTGYGQIGIYVRTLGDCPDCNFDIKIKIIASNTIHLESTGSSF